MKALFLIFTTAIIFVIVFRLSDYFLGLDWFGRKSRCKPTIKPKISVKNQYLSTQEFSQNKFHLFEVLSNEKEFEHLGTFTSLEDSLDFLQNMLAVPYFEDAIYNDCDFKIYSKGLLVAYAYNPDPEESTAWKFDTF
jgi:hypothetical protein